MMLFMASTWFKNRPRRLHFWFQGNAMWVDYIKEMSMTNVYIKLENGL